MTVGKEDKKKRTDEMKTKIVRTQKDKSVNFAS